jgi:tetratricopeptide (TPR) repeat protein
VRVFVGIVLISLAISTAGAAQVDPKTGILEQAGFEALRTGDAARAADAFRDALAADPKNPDLYLGAGVAAWLQRRDDDAQTALERALDLNPHLTEARLFLGQVLYRRGDLAGAIAAYEATERTDGAIPADAAATLARWRHEADVQGGMRQAFGNHFSVSYEGPEAAEFGIKVLESLDRAYWRIGQVLGVYPPRTIPVVIYTTQEFHDITRSPSWAAGAYDGTIRLPARGALRQTEELDRVLAHEFTHALIRMLCVRPIPTWLNEGLATALETADGSSRDLQMTGGARAPALSALTGSFAQLNGSDAEIAYATSARAAARLLEAASGIAVANVLRDLNDGIPLAEAFDRRMPWSLTDFASSVGQ